MIYSSAVGQLPRVSGEDPERIRVDSVVETFFVCSLSVCLQIGQLPRVSGEDPERIRVDSVFETSGCLFVLCLSVSKFSQFLYYKVL